MERRMKALLEFDFDAPGDRDCHSLALNGDKWHRALVEIADWLRSKEKYGSKPTIRIDEVRQELSRILIDSGLSLD